MGRYGRMRTAASEPNDDGDSAGKIKEKCPGPEISNLPLGGPEGVPRSLIEALPPTEGLDPEIIAELEATTINLTNSELASAAVTVAAHLAAPLSSGRFELERKRVRTVARYLAYEAAPSNRIRYREHLRRSNVDSYLATMTPHWKGASLREFKTALYAAGQSVHPREYPDPRRLSAPRTKQGPATNRREVAALYQIAWGLPAALRRNLIIILDLCYGAGIDSRLLKAMRGNNIEAMTVAGREVVVIVAANRAGGDRRIPVVDRVISQRLIAVREEVGDRLLLCPEVEAPEKNLINRVDEALKRHGHSSGVSPSGLRKRWALDLAESVPAALLMQLADVGDLRMLADQRDSLPQYEIRHSVELMLDGEAGK